MKPVSLVHVYDVSTISVCLLLAMKSMFQQTLTVVLSPYFICSVFGLCGVEYYLCDYCSVKLEIIQLSFDSILSYETK